MRDSTLKTRVAELMQKCRKAVRLYSSMQTAAAAANREHERLHVREWLDLNSELLRDLAGTLDEPNPRLVPDRIRRLAVRYEHTRDTSSNRVIELKEKLIDSALRSDFAQAWVMSGELVGLSARHEASAAVLFELEGILGMPDQIELNPDRVSSEWVAAENAPPVRVAPAMGTLPTTNLPTTQLPKVVPLRIVGS